jgi:folate-binding protein YgfZ
VTDLCAGSVPRDAVTVTGPDAVTYLQGQLSQDVAGLGVGDSAWSWLLQPAGKVEALVRVTRTGPEALLVDVDAGYGETVLNRLTRFKLRTKADLALTAVGVLALRGPGAGAAAAALAAAHEATAAEPGAAVDVAAVVVAALWPDGEEAADLLTGVAADGAVVAAHGVTGLSAGGWDAARVAAGVPAMGAELSERTIPAETGLVDATVSFTKGCYTGQELVARIDSRGGNVPRHLRGLRPDGVLAVGDELAARDGKIVGAVTSVAAHPDLGPVALGYVARAVAPGEVVFAAGGAAVTVVALTPLRSS